MFLLTLWRGYRAGIGYTVERLVKMLDAMEPDPELEPCLGDDRDGDDLSVTGGT